MCSQVTHGFLQVPAPCDDQIRVLYLLLNLPDDFPRFAFHQMNRSLHAFSGDLIVECVSVRNEKKFFHHLVQITQIRALDCGRGARESQPSSVWL